MAIVLPMLSVGIASIAINRGMQTQVAQLRSAGGTDLRRVDLETVGLEVEGHWDPAGSFVAREVEVLPGLRRPKLRGAIEALSAAPPTLRLYGVPIRVTGATEFPELEGEHEGFESLRRGQRIEVTCDVEDGVWTARKLRTQGVKDSDKIKGTPTASELDGVAPETVEIHGLRVLLAPARETGTDGVLRRIERATRMSLALQECHAAAHELVGMTMPMPMSVGTLDDKLEFDGDDERSNDADERLTRAGRDFGHYLDQTRPPGTAAAEPSAAGSTVRWVHRLLEQQPLLEAHIAALRRLTRADLAAARAYLSEKFDPFLVADLEPLVYMELSQAEADLSDELRAISIAAALTTRFALWTSAVAVLLALVLGYVVYRSIHRPIVALRDAAVRLGEGRLDTRVELPSGDEFGVLASAFNQMASELARTTVSTANLENVFDSMAGTIILLDAERRITSVNRAATRLLGYERDELLGRPFDCLCPGAGSGAVSAGEDGIVHVGEFELVGKHGTSIPVSFSGAELRPHDGELQGFVCVAQDLTERHRIEEQVRATLAEKELLLREVHHRVKNNMQIVTSLLAMQAGCASDPRVAQSLEQSQSRIRSMALIHEQLYRSADLTQISARPYLEMLIARLQESCATNGTVRVDVEVDELELDLDQSLACGLIVNELVSNSFKHAFPDGRSGQIRVRLEATESGACLLEVVDDGVGLPRASGGELELQRAGTLGMSLVATVVRQLKGQMTTAGDAGLQIQITFAPKQAARQTAGRAPVEAAQPCNTRS